MITHYAIWTKINRSTKVHGTAMFTIIDCREVRHTLGQHTAMTRTDSGDILLLYGDYTDNMEGQTGYLPALR